MQKLYIIKPQENFFKQAAKIVLNSVYNAETPETLANCQVWVPSNRIANSLKDEITKTLGNYAILPEIKTISLDESDIEGLTPPNSPKY